MPPAAIRISLYWLRDGESYLGDCPCRHEKTSWLRLSRATPGSIAMASQHLFFDDGVGPVLQFALHCISMPAISETRSEVKISFQCREVYQRAVIPTPTAGAAEGSCIPAPLSPFDGPEQWAFVVGKTYAAAIETLRLLLSGRSYHEIQLRREVALQTASAAVSFRVRRVAPMVEQRGVLYIHGDAVVFEPLFPLPSHSSLRVKSLGTTHMFPRWVAFDKIGLDFYSSPSMEAEAQLSLLFSSPHEREEAMHLIEELPHIGCYRVAPLDVMANWLNGSLSNYDYLLYLNRWSSRCSSDASQYPVMPWILADYTSPVLDLTLESTFRPLSKPLGAIGASRLESLRQREAYLRETEEEAYLYTTHFSSVGVLCYYLLRSHPEYQMSLQGGTLDVPERRFQAIGRTWQSVTSSAGDFKELIPQFYNNQFPSLCSPVNGWPYLSEENTAFISALGLPPWAVDAADFARKHRAAMESPYVSAHLHEWIDLIFGVAQDGEAAVTAANTFHPSCYAATAIREAAVGGGLVAAAQYAKAFGSMPIKLFTVSHPARGGTAARAGFTAAALECGGGGSPTTAATATPWAMDPQLHHLTAQLQKVVEESDHSESELSGATAKTMPVVGVLAEVASVLVRCSAASMVAIGSARRREPCLSISDGVEGLVLLVVTAEGRQVLLFDATTGDRLRTFSDFDAPVVHCTSGGAAMLLFTDCGSCYALDVATKAIQHCVEQMTPAAVFHSCITSSTLVLADAEANVAVWVHENYNITAAMDNCPALQFEAASSVVALAALMPVTGGTLGVSQGGDVFQLTETSLKDIVLQWTPPHEAIRGIAQDSQDGFWVFYDFHCVQYDSNGKQRYFLALPGVASALSPLDRHHHLHPVCLLHETPYPSLVLIQHGRHQYLELPPHIQSPFLIRTYGSVMVFLSPDSSRQRDVFLFTLVNFDIA